MVTEVRLQIMVVLVVAVLSPGHRLSQQMAAAVALWVAVVEAAGELHQEELLTYLVAMERQVAMHRTTHQVVREAVAHLAERAVVADCGVTHGHQEP